MTVQLKNYLTIASCSFRALREVLTRTEISGNIKSFLLDDSTFLAKHMYNRCSNVGVSSYYLCLPLLSILFSFVTLALSLPRNHYSKDKRNNMFLI